MLPRLLMIEDDQRLADMLATYLRQNSYEVEHVTTAQAGLELLRKPLSGADTPFSLVLLDLMLPDANGLDVCRRIRSGPGEQAHMPVVMLTAKGDPMDKVIGLELGADDYVSKPFEPRELLARLRALLRRQRTQTADASGAGRILRFGRLEIKPDAHTLSVDGVERSLTAYQFHLLLALAERAGRVLSREQLLDALKGETQGPFDRSIDVHIGRLRAAIEDDPRQPKRIITVRGAGYVFAKVQDV